MHAQLGFCTGNSGDPIFTENFGTGTDYGPPLPAGTTDYNFVGFNGPQDGQYTVGSNTFSYGWNLPSDHTVGDTNGKALIVNASFTTGEFYRRSVSDLCENTTYEFSSWLINILPSSGCGGNGIPVNVQFEIWDITDTSLLASGDTGDIFSSAAPTWLQYGLVFQTLPGQTAIILKMINNGAGGCGNDLAIDDIEFKSCGDLIAVQDSNGNDSVVICSSQTPYSDTITAIPDFAVFQDHFYQWQVSADGLIWTDIADETNASISLTGITESTYYRTKVAEFATNLSNSDCITFSDTYLVTVNPSPPVPMSNGDADFNCNTNQAILSVMSVSGITINWYDSAVGGVLLQSNSETYTATTSGIYYAEAVDATTGCVSVTRIAVNALSAALPDAPVSDGDIDFNCLTNEATLSVTVSSGIIVNWYDTAVDGILLESDSTTYLATNEGTYYAEAVNTTTGCVSLVRTAVSTSIVLPDTAISDGDVSLDCDTNEATLSVTVPNGVIVDWFDAANAGGLLASNSTTLVVNLEGVYYAEARDPITGCVSATRVAVNANITTQDDASFDVTPTCDGATVTIIGTTGGTFVFNPVPTDGATIDSTTGNVTNGISGANYTIDYSTSGVCSATSTQTFSVLFADDASFAITPTCDGGVSTVTGLVGGAFSFNPAPIDGALIDSTTGLLTGGVPDTTYTIEYTTNGDCPSSSIQLVTVNSEVLLVSPTPLEVCDDGTPDGLTEIDLSLKNTDITGNNPNYAISYYVSLADAQTETSPLPTLYTNTINPETVFVRVEDINTGCFDTTTLELMVQQAPVANISMPLRYCDPDNDGFGVFTLTDADNEITGGSAGLTLSYHETLANANNNVDAIDTSVTYNNIVVNMQMLYARVESATIATDCATVVELQLIVEPTPQLLDPTPLEACDDISADGFATFDLTTKAPEVLNGQDPTQYILSYYETEVNADLPNNPIANPAAYTNTTANTQVIWIRVEDNTTVEGCYKLTTLELIVNPLPVLVAPVPLELCDVNNPGDEAEAFTLEDANAEILNGQTGITLSYYETQMDADNATSPIMSPYTNTSAAQTIYVRAENDITGCYNTVTVTLRVDPIPSPEPDPDPIEVCDEDNDGFAEFDLEIRTIEITNGEPNVEISYHETQTDAELGDNPIIGGYTNIVANTQMIYVRSENTLTGCYSLTLNTLELIVVASPEVSIDLEPLVVCDDSNDGITQFDLTLRDADILGGQNPADVILSYHVSAADAETGVNPIINTANYTNISNPQIIYVRLFNPTTSCQDTGEFELQVNLPPEAVQPSPLELCDDLGESPGDEMTVFDLTVKDAEITAGNASWSVAYYETDADAQVQMNAIPDPTQYTNTSIGGLPQNPQTLYVVVTDSNTGCVDFVILTIRVLPNPTPTPSDQLPDMELCDEVNTGDGVELFNLLGLAGTNAQEDLILNGEAGVTASYHETAEDADSGMNPILDPANYENIQTPEQEIYVRVTNNGTGCYTIVDFTIRVNPLPEVVAVTDFIQCELNTDGFDSFDLTTKDAEVLNGQDATQFIVTYYENIADAEVEMNALVSPYINTSNPQQIFVTITNNVTGCSISTQRFNIQVDEAAQANPDMIAIVYEECDDNMEIDGDPSNDSVQFDLATRDPEVLDGQDAANYIVSYYATEADATLNVNPLPNLYENIINPQVIYARVDNNTLSVIPIALDLEALTAGLDLDANGTIDTYDTDADGVFDLVDVDGDGLSDAIDSNADGLIDFVDIDGDGLGDPVDLNNDGIFDNQADGSICFEVAPLTLQVNPLPAFDLDDSYILCVNTNGTEILNLPMLDTGLSDTDYSFEWSYNSTVLPAETSSSLIPTQGGTYSVTVTDISTSIQTSCTNTDTTEVIESEPPSLEVNILTQAFGNTNVIEAIATGIGNYEYSLDAGPWQDSGIFTGVSQGQHEVTARDKIGCGLTTTPIFVIDYPLYFTPNGDSNHDTWNIEGIGSTAKIYIFDRYGKLIKQLSPTGSGWDGTYNGNMMPTSDYWFTVEYDEPLTGNRKEFKAHFTLKR
jgi:gliding motility-associated-like protein